MSRTRLSEDQITAALAELPQWTRTGDAITRTAETASFPTAIKVVDAVAEQAEALDHHPDIDIRWRTLTFLLTTHSEGGLTSLDITVAHLIDQALDDAA
ncbi:4a-hydroxytetrahydrobiopterin dehydratase [Streptomyces sp. TLI_171]|uniref:4a-hydroxytetrahydrobiopterin dehydratase n=1 Tax=Streptomyces sp. TLI_171 TaxID=1938859 RepID=UPI000C1983AF|nr:4a-hydroxytetrahydrobiopterin dehydratase [Streptomyces sp. TLI_171]RKE21848.1 pterin-4-alpha-carbinolamine dehydratase [Streptomyces sp. TLI_171]